MVLTMLQNDLGNPLQALLFPPFINGVIADTITERLPVVMETSAGESACT